jgi:hypothetical protein
MSACHNLVDHYQYYKKKKKQKNWRKKKRISNKRHEREEKSNCNLVDYLFTFFGFFSPIPFFLIYGTSSLKLKEKT